VKKNDKPLHLNIYKDFKNHLGVTPVEKEANSILRVFGLFLYCGRAIRAASAAYFYPNVIKLRDFRLRINDF
jgi:hypothetical protein